jgi:hypothetical protein
MSEAQIIQTLRNPSMYSFYNLNNVLKILYKNKGNILSTTGCSAIFKLLRITNQHNNNNYNAQYYKNTVDITLNYLQKMFVSYTPSHSEMTLLFSNNIFFTNNKYIALAVKVLVDRDINVLKIIPFKNIVIHNKHVVPYISKLYKPHKNDMTYLAEHGCAYLLSYLILQKYKIDDGLLSLAFKSKSGETVKVLTDIGMKATQLMFNQACITHNDPIMFKVLLSSKNINPTEKNFNDLINRAKDISPEPRGYYYRQAHVNKNINKLEQSILAEIFDHFIERGFKITEDHVIRALNKYVYFNNIEDHSKITHKIYAICAKLNYYPYELNITPDISVLQGACCHAKNLTKIKKLIKQKLKPDSVCLENACAHTNNFQTIKYLIEKHKIVPNIKCVKNITNNISNKTLNIIVDALYKQSQNNKDDSDNPDSAEDDDNSVDDDNVDDNVDNVDDNDVDDVDDVDDIDDVSIKKVIKNKSIKKKVIKKKSISKLKTKSGKQILIENDTDDTIDEIKNKDIKTETPNNKDIKIETIKSKPIVIDISLTHIKLNKRKKYKVTSNMVKFWSLDKTIKLSFLDIRKKLREYILTNKLLKGKFVKTDDRLCNVLKLDKGIFNLTDLDNIVMKFY